MANTFYVFGSYRLDPVGRALLRGEEAVELTSREFDTLWLLVRGGGEVVSKELLVREIWGVNVVDDGSNNLSKQIGAVRNKLGKNPAGESYIRTIPNNGYLLTTPVTLQIDSGQPETGPVYSAVEAPHVLRNLKIWIALSVAGAILIFSWAAVSMKRVPLKRSQRPLIAILPFRAWPDTLEVKELSAVVTEMMRTELGSSEALRMIPGEDVARFVATKSLPDAGAFSSGTLLVIHQNLNSTLVISGSVSRIAESGELRIDARVQDALTGDTAASESVSGTEASVLDLVARCGGLLRARLSISQSPGNQTQSYRGTLPANVEAAQLYIRGLARLRASDALGARRLFQSASQNDPRSPMIRSALAEAWSALGYEERARDEARRALESSRDLPREHQLLIEGRFSELSRAWPQALAAYEALWKFFPDDLEHGLRLAHVQTEAGMPADADRTISQMRKTEGRDDVRIDLAEAENAEAIGEFERELDAARRATRKGEAAGNQLLFARALLRSSWALDKLGNRLAARHGAERAAAQFAVLGDKGGEAQAIRLTADVLDDSDDHAGAVPIFEKALTKFREIGYQTGIATTLNNMAYAVKYLGRLDEAQRYFEESAAIAVEIGDRGREAMGLNGLGGILWRQGRLSEAETTYKKASAGFIETGKRNHAATVLGNLAAVQQDEGKLADAQRSFEQSLEILRPLGDQTGIARTFGNLGQLLLLRGDPVAAKANFDDQLAIGKKIGEDKQQAYALQGLGEVYFARGDNDRARRSLNEALALRNKSGEADLASETKLTIAQVGAELGDATAGVLARSLVSYFEREKRMDEAMLARSVVIRAALNSRPPDLAAAAAEARLIRSGSAGIQDQAILLWVETELARYSSAAGDRRSASKLLKEVIRQASEEGYRERELAAALAQSEIERDPELRRRSLQQIEDESRHQALLRIATSARQLRTGEHP